MKKGAAIALLVDAFGLGIFSVADIPWREIFKNKVGIKDVAFGVKYLKSVGVASTTTSEKAMIEVKYEFFILFLNVQQLNTLLRRYQRLGKPFNLLNSQKTKMNDTQRGDSAMEVLTADRPSFAIVRSTPNQKDARANVTTPPLAENISGISNRLTSDVIGDEVENGTDDMINSSLFESSIIPPAKRRSIIMEDDEDCERSILHHHDQHDDDHNGDRTEEEQTQTEAPSEVASLVKKLKTPTVSQRTLAKKTQRISSSGAGINFGHK